MAKALDVRRSLLRFPVHRQIDETLLREGRGQAVGLYSRFIWRWTPRADLPASRLPRVAILSVARSWAVIIALTVPLPCGESPSVMFPKVRPPETMGLAIFTRFAPKGTANLFGLLWKASYFRQLRSALLGRTPLRTRELCSSLERVSVGVWWRASDHHGRA